MKKECVYTKRALPEYLRGHVFRNKQKRIESHLQSCVICHSEFAALKRKEETLQLLKDIDSPEGVSHRIRGGFSVLARFKKLLYRPLWIAGILVASAGIYYYTMMPRQIDLEIENIVASSPVSTLPVSSSPILASDPSAEHKAGALEHRTMVSSASPAPGVEPLVILITPENESAAINQINEVMRGHAQLRMLKFSDTVREINGSLTGGELMTLFNRISPAAKVTFNRKRFESFPAAHQIPVVLKLNASSVRAVISAPIAHPTTSLAETEESDEDEEADPQEPAPPSSHVR